jgi:AraC-like DNA-binding protein
MSVMPTPVSDALAFVRHEWSGGRLRAIRMHELADAASVSTGHFARQFRAYYAIGAATALERLRLARAAAMLLSGNEPLARVATTCGFADAYHFSKRFSAVYGIPPGRYRRSRPDLDADAPLGEARLRAMAATLWPPTAIEQVVNTSAPAPLQPGRSYGQSFRVPFGLSLTQVRFMLATYSSTTSGITVTLHRDDPAGVRERVAAKRIEPMTDNTTEWLTIPPHEHGRYYLELTEPTGTPTWWWHQGNVSAVGGTAHIDGSPVHDTNFIFSATAVGPASTRTAAHQKGEVT